MPTPDATLTRLAADARVVAAAFTLVVLLSQASAVAAQGNCSGIGGP